MESLTIGTVARDTGIPIRRIRFYEEEGLLPPPARTGAGYRIYTPNDVRRLRLIRNARLLGLALPQIRTLVDQAFASDCVSFAPQLKELIASQKMQIDERIDALRSLRVELDELEAQVAHAQCATEPGQQVSECACCPMIDE